MGIEVRGSSSQIFPKKAYGLETRTPRGENRPVSLLGMPRESDWVLLASYDDKTLMRTAIAYRAARRLGRYASRLQHVELVLNGRYQGVYLLGDREDLSARRAAWTRRYVGRFERALHGAGFRDRRRLRAAQRVLQEPRPLPGSAYTHKGTGGKARARTDVGPRPVHGQHGPPGEQRDHGALLDDYRWTRRLYRDPTFARATARRWRVLRRQGLLGDVLRDVDRTAVALRPGAQLRPLGRPGHERLIRARGALPGTYAREVDYMKWFLRERATWMDANVGRLAGT